MSRSSLDRRRVGWKEEEEDVDMGGELMAYCLLRAMCRLIPFEGWVGCWLEEDVDAEGTVLAMESP